MQRQKYVSKTALVLEGHCQGILTKAVLLTYFCLCIFQPFDSLDLEVLLYNENQSLCLDAYYGQVEHQGHGGEEALALGGWSELCPLPFAD